jgi:hypothetical protein
MRKLFAALTIALISGCSSPETYDLGSEWAPLKGITERPDLVSDLASDTATTTVGQWAYVKDLDEWLVRVPPGSAKFKALMRHEQEHSRRQLDTGTWQWIGRYAVDKDFALLEEQIGYYYEITERRRLGDQVAPEAYATVLSNYKILAGRLISYADALNWVRAVLSGQWVPPS